MAASYPSSTKSFTSHSAAQTVASADINAIQDEVVAVENGLRTGVAHDLIPDADNTRDLGSAAKQWNDAFLGGRLVTPNIAVDATGFIDSATQPRCSAFNSAVQSVADATATALTFDSEDFDVGSVHSTVTNTSRLTVPTGGDGLYLIIGQATYAASATGIRQTLIKKNGATNLAQTIVASNTAASITEVQIQTLAVLAAADYVELIAVQNSGGALNVGSASREGAGALQIVKLW